MSKRILIVISLLVMMTLIAGCSFSGETKELSDLGSKTSAVASKVSKEVTTKKTTAKKAAKKDAAEKKAAEEAQKEAEEEAKKQAEIEAEQAREAAEEAKKANEVKEESAPKAPSKSVASNYVGQSVASLKAAVGSPISSSYAQSCIGSGDDGILRYNGFTVYTYRENGKETVQSVE